MDRPAARRPGLADLASTTELVDELVGVVGAGADLPVLPLGVDALVGSAAAGGGFVHVCRARRSGRSSVRLGPPGHPVPGPCCAVSRPRRPVLRRRRPRPRQAPRRRGLRLRPSAPLAPQTRHPPPHRTRGHRVLAAARPPQGGRRKDRVLARRLPSAPSPIRAQGRTPPRLRRQSRSPHLSPPPHQMKRPLRDFDELDPWRRVIGGYGVAAARAARMASIPAGSPFSFEKGPYGVPHTGVPVACRQLSARGPASTTL